jgi:hypothetical protein
VIAERVGVDLTPRPEPAVAAEELGMTRRAKGGATAALAMTLVARHGLPMK